MNTNAIVKVPLMGTPSSASVVLGVKATIIAASASKLREIKIRFFFGTGIGNIFSPPWIRNLTEISTLDFQRERVYTLVTIFRFICQPISRRLGVGAQIVSASTLSSLDKYAEFGTARRRDKIFPSCHAVRKPGDALRTDVLTSNFRPPGSVRIKIAALGSNNDLSVLQNDGQCR
jgi:hypothetical protein